MSIDFNALFAIGRSYLGLAWLRDELVDAAGRPVADAHVMVENQVAKTDVSGKTSIDYDRSITGGKRDPLSCWAWCARCPARANRVGTSSPYVKDPILVSR